MSNHHVTNTTHPNAGSPGPGAEPDEHPYDLIVVGAGIAGLAAALTGVSGLAGVTGTTDGAGRRGPVQPPRILVLDAHPAGGRARTSEQAGFLHNVGPHAMYRSGALAALLARHGVEVSGGEPASGAAIMVRDGQGHPMRLSPGSMLRTSLLTPGERLRLLALFATVQRAKPAQLVGTSVDDWLAPYPRRVRQFADMLIRVSSYTDAPDVFDAGAAVAQLQLAIGPGVQYLDGGWQSIVAGCLDVLAAAGVDVRTDEETLTVRSVDRSPLVSVTTSNTTHTAHSVVIAGGGPETAERLTGATVRGLDRITPPVTASTLDLALATARPALAFALDAPLYLSAHAPAARLAPEGHGLVSLMRYHAPGADAGDPAVRRAELRAFARHVGIGERGDEREVLHERYLHRMVVTHGAPTASGGGLAGRPAVDALGLPGVYLAGDWVGAEGLLADAAAASGIAAARAAAQRCASITG
ncbi:MAG: FAD-dependent oxidoreductase [Actinobacteria bacterium]|nr:FAD-dependent oxidoreductase [Actinomycetota bacterium]